MGVQAADGDVDVALVLRRIVDALPVVQSGYLHSTVAHDYCCHRFLKGRVKCGELFEARPSYAVCNVAASR